MPARRNVLLPGLTALVAGLFLLTSALLADPPAAPPTGSAGTPGTPPAAGPVSEADLKARQEQNAKLFKDFKDKLFQLQTRLDKSERPEAKEQAKSIKAALELAEKQGVDSQFSKLLLEMARGGKNLNDYQKLQGEEAELAKMLQAIMTVLMTDDESARIKEEIRRLEEFKKELEAIKKRTENHQAKTDSKKGDPNKLAGDQKDLAEQTKKIADQMNGKVPDGKPGADAKKDDRAEPKGEPKSGEPSGDAKDDTGEAKGDAKEAGDPKNPTDPKAPPPSESKGSGKGEPKDAGDSKGGEPKEAAGDAKGGDSKPMDPKGGGDKPPTGDPKPPMPMGDKPADPKPSDSKGQGEGKGQGKPSDSKSPAGEGKGSGESKPMDGGGQPPPPGGQKGGGEPKPGGGGQPQPPKPPESQVPGRKEVQEAVPPQQDAGKDLDKDEREKASKNQDKAIDKLQQAIKELEKKLKQLREEEMRKLLANIEARCGKMLTMQIEVYEQTKSIDAAIQKAGGQKGTADIQKSQQQEAKEGEIVAEADRALKLLESEGSAVAFAKVLEEVRQDMIATQRRLGSTVVDKDTQEIEAGIIAILKDMMEALKKAQQELSKDKKDGGGGGGGGKKDQKLIDLLAELKLIRNMQVQVNTRTKMYGSKDKGEQSADPLVQAELKQLSSRQAKLQEMIDKIATGENQ